MNTLQDSDDDEVRRLCARMLDLLSENDTLRCLVADMATSVPREKWDDHERAMYDDTVNRWKQGA